MATKRLTKEVECYIRWNYENNSFQSELLLIPRKIFNKKSKLKNLIEKKQELDLESIISIEVFSENEDVYEVFNYKD